MAPRRGWRWRRRLPTALVLLTTITVVASSLLGGYASVETYTPARTHCPAEGGNFSAGSMYQANIDGLLHSLRDGAATNAGFLNTTFGVPNDEVFGVAMCFADVSWSDCKKCLNMAPSYMMSTACPSGRTGALLYNECLLRYSDEYFASMQTDTDQSPYVVYVEAYVGDMVSMNNTRWKMMDRLIAEAAVSPLRYFLDNNETYTDPTTGTRVYGIVQCRRDLTTEECTKCLNYLVRILLDNYPNDTAAVFKGFSCFARYHPEPIELIMVPSSAPGMLISTYYIGIYIPYVIVRISYCCCCFCLSPRLT